MKIDVREIFSEIEHQEEEAKKAEEVSQENTTEKTEATEDEGSQEAPVNQVGADAEEAVPEEGVTEAYSEEAEEQQESEAVEDEEETVEAEKVEAETVAAENVETIEDIEAVGEVESEAVEPEKAKGESETADTQVAAIETVAKKPAVDWGNFKKKLSSACRDRVWLAGTVGALVVLIGMTYAVTSMIPKEVNATINGEKVSLDTKKNCIEELLNENKIAYCSADYISKPLETFVYDGMELELVHAKDVALTADGKTKKYKTLGVTVQDFIDKEGVKVRELDIVTPAYETLVAQNMNVVIKRVDIKEEIVEEEVPFKTVNKDDSSMNEGSTKVVTEGKSGMDKVTYQIKYIDGVAVTKQEIARENVTPVTDKVIAVGTRINLNGISYSKKMTVKAYSYTGGGRTAMGTRARVGEIAVDPSVIPLGTKVYIEGVGVRRAEDTGGNIKGNTIDIYMDTVSQCRNWGVRYVTIYIQ